MEIIFCWELGEENGEREKQRKRAWMRESDKREKPNQHSKYNQMEKKRIVRAPTYYYERRVRFERDMHFRIISVDSAALVDTQLK